VSESGSETTSDAAVVDPQVDFERAVARRRSRKRVDVVDFDVASASSGAVRFHLRHDVHAAADRISLRHAPSYRQRALLSAEARSRTMVDRTRPPSPSYVHRVTTCHRSWRHRRLETERWPPLKSINRNTTWLVIEQACSLWLVKHLLIGWLINIPWFSDFNSADDRDHALCWYLIGK